MTMPATFPVYLFEEHSSTLPVWWQYRSNPRPAVYLDAHLDLQPISSDQLQALEHCDHLEQIKALGSPHHLNLANHYAYGIENFLYPASKLKLIDRLIWVAPRHLPRAYESSLLEYIQQMDGISFDELTGFQELAHGSIRGHLLGLDITICEFGNLDKLNIGNEYYLDIDIDYFVKVPDDQLWIDPAGVVEQVLDQLGAPVLATVSRAVISGHTPLSLRFIGDYVTAVLAQDKSGILHFQNLYRATILIDKGQTQQAIKLCQQNIDSRPDCAASHFILDRAMRPDDEDAWQLNSEHASELDSQYTFDLSREASGFPNRNRRLNNEQLSTLTTQLETLKFEATERALAEVAIGQLYAEAGMLKQAWQLMRKQNGDLASHSDLLLAIARGILASKEPQKAKPLLELASNTIRTRTSATLFLGDLAYRAGDAQQALKYYQRVSEYAPAWMAPLERQLYCFEKLGETAQFNEISELIEQRKQVLSRLIGDSPD